MGRIYVSIDAEGLPGVFHISQLTPRGHLFNELREIMTKVIGVVADELARLSYEEVWVADSHGFMGNASYLELPENVVLIRGSPRPISMVSCIDRGFDAAMFIGYHSAAGTPRSVADHTYSGTAFFEIRVNGARASEFYINALVAGYYDVPVILVAGDDKLRADVEEKTPWATYVVLKESLSRSAIVVRSLPRVLEDLRMGIREAVEKLRSGRAKPLKIESPIIAEFVMRRSEYADAAENIPSIERIDAYTLRYRARNPVELYRVMNTLALIAIAIESLTKL